MHAAGTGHEVDLVTLVADRRLLRHITGDTCPVRRSYNWLSPTDPSRHSLIKMGKPLRVIEESIKQWRKLEIPEKTHRSTASSGTILTCRPNNLTRIPLANRSATMDVPFPLLLHSRRCTILAYFTLISSHDLDVKSRPYLFTHSWLHMAEEYTNAHTSRSQAGLPKVLSYPWRATVAEWLACSPSHQGDTSSVPGAAHSGFSHVGIVPDDAVGRRVFSGISPRTISFRRCSIPQSPSSALKTSMLKAVQISSLTRYSRCDFCTPRLTTLVVTSDFPEALLKFNFQHIPSPHARKTNYVVLKHKPKGHRSEVVRTQCLSMLQPFQIRCIARPLPLRERAMTRMCLVGMQPGRRYITSDNHLMARDVYSASSLPSQPTGTTAVLQRDAALPNWKRLYCITKERDRQRVREQLLVQWMLLPASSRRKQQIPRTRDKFLGLATLCISNKGCSLCVQPI
ncbi:hypothetical protein PR048_032610 [Dryococelus australis]|uniref:Uncharacterized protein n=1 Tax=Dryococelus australis TaxID=614101 RepID=A0ABQ9G2Q0_9NEOP|nr:hypothetical protein PR048_032610 [Dryococelus australis]